MAGNLHAALKSHISGHHAKGLTNNTLYVRLWEGIPGDLHKSSHSFWSARSAPQKTLHNVLLARFGGLYNQKLAYRYENVHRTSIAHYAIWRMVRDTY